MTDEMEMTSDIIKWIQNSKHDSEWMFISSHEDAKKVIITFKHRPSHEMEDK
jgi:hypothetical protein